MQAGVVKLDVNGVLGVVVDALDNTNGIPDHETGLEMNWSGT